MKSPRWFGGRRFELWLSAFILVFMVGVAGPSVIGSVVSAGTGWNWIKLLVWTCVVVSFTHTFVTTLRDRQSPEVALPTPEVSAADAEQIVSREPKRVAAIKALRQRHPGLNLKEAAELVDVARAERGPKTEP